MDINPSTVLLIASILLFISVLVSKTASKTGLPALAIFLFIGMLAGSDGIGKISFNSPATAQFLGIVALCFILFSGGLDTKLKQIKPVLWRGISLSTVGVLITAVTLGFFVHWITDFGLMESMLLGSIVSSTDAAAVFAIFRSKNTGLKRNLRPTLELESGSNDPMAYFLTITFISIIQHPETSFWSMIPLFLKGTVLGLLMGYFIGKITVRIINKVGLFVEGLYPVLTIAMMFFSFSLTEFIGGNGFLSIYLSGLILGNSNFIHKRSLLRFYDGFAWLMQIVMFLSLGLLVFPSQMTPIIGIGLLISAFLIFVARPLAVFLCLWPFKMYYKDLILISWVGLKGAVPIIFATYAMVEKIPNADTIFHIVFFITLTSLLLQGTSLFKVAEKLKLTIPEGKAKKTILEFDSETIKSVLEEIMVEPDFRCVDHSIVDMELPKTALIVMIERDDKYFTPNGSTIIEAGDRLTILADSKDNLDTTFNALKT
ncbi:MAG: potassium/proton antiporter [Bacteroidales bacterium]|jgi:cell volume regulation protein A|nr:potassium/proton antiporter [Bacteroidales bacterium]